MIYNFSSYLFYLVEYSMFERASVKLFEPQNQPGDENAMDFFYKTGLI